MAQIHLLAPVLLKFYPRCDSDKKKIVTTIIMTMFLV